MLRVAVACGLVVLAAVAGGIAMRGEGGARDAKRVVSSGASARSELRAPGGLAALPNAVAPRAAPSGAVAPGVLSRLRAPARPLRSVVLQPGSLRPVPGQLHTPCFREGSLPCVPVCTYRVQGAAPGRGGCPSLAPQGCLHLAASRRPPATCGPGSRGLPRVVIRRP